MTVGIVALVSLAIVVAIGTTQRRSLTQAALPSVPMRFDEREAMSDTRALAEGYPDRVTGSNASQRAARFIAAQFRKLGYRVRLQRFDIWLHGERAVGENVIAYRRLPPTVLLCAHYDGATTTHQAAEDDGSGVGILLEMARALRGRSDDVAFAATDAEEWGMVGSRHLAESAALRPDVAISIDYVNAGPVSGLQLTSSGQFRGYTPPWLRGLMKAAAQGQTETVAVPSGWLEWVERALEFSFQDQGPLLGSGIPAVNVLTIPGNVAATRERYHTTKDVFANFRPSSFAMVGRTVERATLALLSQRYRGTADGGFMLSPDAYISARALFAMQLVALLPLIVGWATLLPQTKLGRDDVRLLVRLVPPLAAYGVLLVLTAAKALPRYDLDPATLKDPFLYHPPVTIAAILAGTIVLGYVLIASLDARPQPFDKRRLVAWAIPLCAVAFIIRPFAMWLYLGIFAYSALLFVESKSKGALLINVSLLLLAVSPLLVIFVHFADETFLGPYILWYVLLQAAYGMLRPATVFVAIFSLLLWFEFLVLALRQHWIAKARVEPVNQLVGGL